MLFSFISITTIPNTSITFKPFSGMGQYSLWQNNISNFGRGCDMEYLSFLLFITFISHLFYLQAPDFVVFCKYDFPH
jgi:hypothetical protein